MKRDLVTTVLVASCIGTLAAQPSVNELDALRPRLLTELSRKQAQVVCEAVQERQDLCAAAGRWRPMTCEAVVERCRAQEKPPKIDCSLARFDFGSSCTATVDQYLACVEDWEKILPCSAIELGRELDARRACLPLLEACPHFIPEYGDPATYTPPCDAANAPMRVDDDDDVRGLDACRPVPARMVTLGDSIAACTLATDADGTYACAPNLIAAHLRETVAPKLTYQTFAIPGAFTAEGVGQARQVAPGPGHIYVWVYLGGNDIAPCGGSNEAAALACLERETEEIRSEWDPIFAYFSDRSNFPDGATFLLNTQYALADECVEPGIKGTPTTPAISLALQAYNQRVFIDRALERSDTIAIDHYPDFVGRGANANNARCPHCYRGDNTSWLSDRVHPSATGQRHIADKWRVALDATFAACTPSR